MSERDSANYCNQVPAVSTMVLAAWGIALIFLLLTGARASGDDLFRLFNQVPDRSNVSSDTNSSIATKNSQEVDSTPDQLKTQDIDKVEPDIYSADTILDGDPPLDLPNRPVSASRIFSPKYFENVESASPELLDEQTDRQAESPFAETPWLFERPEWSTGWWASADVSIVKPLVNSGMNSGSLLANSFPANPVQLPFAPLHWTAAPTVRFGYRPTIGRAGFAVSYRGLISDGRASIAAFDTAGSGQLYSRINLQMIDIDAVFVDTVEKLPAFLPSLLECNFGVRTVGSQFISSGSGQQILSVRQSNQFVGSGLHAAFKLEWPIGNSPWSLISRTDFAGLIGQNRQDFSQTIVGPPRTSDSASMQNTTSTTILNAQVGVSCVPARFNRQLRLTGGYEYERWWSIGTSSSSTEFQFQGLVLRSYWSF